LVETDFAHGLRNELEGSELLRKMRKNFQKRGKLPRTRKKQKRWKQQDQK
jgi:hypothetical protein